MALERRLFERKRTVLIEESMDRLEFLVEERSMAEVLKVLLPRILPASWVLDENYFIRPHEGKSDLKRSIPKKLKGFAQHKEQTTGFIIIQDQDSNDCRQLKQELVALCKANQAPNIKFLVRIGGLVFRGYEGYSGRVSQIQPCETSQKISVSFARYLPKSQNKA